MQMLLRNEKQQTEMMESVNKGEELVAYIGVGFGAENIDVS